MKAKSLISKSSNVFFVLGVSLILSACSGSSTEEPTEVAEIDDPVVVNPPAEMSELDQQLTGIIAANNLTGDPTTNRDLPSVNDPIVQLGKRLFFTKSLGGNQDAACVSCHHPALGGGDDISLPVGIDAANPDLIGVGRTNGGVPTVPRNSPTVFNAGLWDSGMFWDSRVESLGKQVNQNGAASGIRTPDSNFGVADPDAGSTLPAAQARFPVTSVDEMKSEDFEGGSTNQAIRDHLAARIGDYGIGSGELTTNSWLAAFQEAFQSEEIADDLITYDRIAHALGEYERSMVFVNNPWKSYVEGDLTALTDQQKQGAILFFTPANQGGAGCVNCHNGDKFTDERHHVIAFPQFGPGKGDAQNDDFGRERETGNQNERYHFRTPSLLNVTVTAPYGHSGAYATLAQVIQHYNNPGGSVDDFFDDSEWCDMPQFAAIPNCQGLFPDSENNSQEALNKLLAERAAGSSLFLNTNINRNERDQIEAFLNALTDPCVTNRECLSAWIPEESEALDDNQIQAVDQNGNLL
ncbi:cytochrome-c peroxidase [Aliikangiella coralliicola]|uniref:Cytochrome C peroxidase n=1 Tax=Aliikangiella coralliicola TaxID=2592383 RepID=A0A545UIS4_9GAMM|nr:cytochrome c peroxidase [Aliikangiella coralliicola]TQV89374.1 cytochrome C peroxidase [Aliikangiella coralliicola]